MGASIGGSYQESKQKNKWRPFDPLQNLPAERKFITDRLFSDAYARPAERSFDFGGGGNPYVGPRPEQEAAMASLSANTRASQPLFSTGVDTLRRTAAGEYLDVANNPNFKALSDARMATARDLFGDLSGGIDSRAAARGIYDSSARLSQRNRAGERVSTQAAEDIARAGFGQYGAERGFQQGASQFGAELNPRLSGQMFGQGEQLRGAQQRGNEFQQTAQLQRGLAQMKSYLEQRGMDQNAINQLLNYMRVAGSSPVQTEGKTSGWGVQGSVSYGMPQAPAG